MRTGTVSHDESMVVLFMEDPEFAEHIMSEILADGDEEEISQFQSWYDEARARTFGAVANGAAV